MRHIYASIRPLFLVIAFMFIGFSAYAQLAQKQLYFQKSGTSQVLNRNLPSGSTQQTETLYKNAVSVVNSSSFKTSNSGTSNGISTTYTVAAGSNRLLVVGVGSTPTTPVTGVTYNSTALTKLGEISNGTAVKAEIWYMIAPPVATNAPFALNLSGNLEAAVGVANYI